MKMTAVDFSRDAEVNYLKSENRSLSRDLRQCQADKDFVWSLWKKLQVSSPDVTKAVSLVIQREREKAEQKDRKVLEILQMKDEKIEALTFDLSDKKQELGESRVRRADSSEDISRLQREVETLRDRNATLDLQAIETECLRTADGRAQNHEQSHYKAVAEAETDKTDLLQKIQSLGSELEKIRTEKADEMALRIQMENKVRVLDMEVTSKVNKFEDLIKELEEARSLLRRFESQARQQQQDLEYKNHELEVVRRELAELWTTHNQLTEHSGQQADVIRQIQSIQTDTQKMLKNQEDAHVMESSSLQQMYTDLTSRYDQAKKMESDLRQQVLLLKKDLLDKADTISDLQAVIDKDKENSNLRPGRNFHSGSFLGDEKIEPVLDMEYKVRSMQREIDNLRNKLQEKERHIEDLEDAVNQTIEFDVARLNSHERTHSTPARQFRSVASSPMKASQTAVSKRARSVSPGRKQKDPLHNRYQLQKDLDDAKAILRLKIQEISELKRAHNKRLERLKSVQENYKNVKDQLKTLEAEYYGSKKKQKIKRADPKDLRHEDSKAVWNELAYFKNENRTLVMERMNLEEELDGLRVQASQDAATVHELKVSLDQEKEERVYEKKKFNSDIQDRMTRQSEITLLKSEVQNKQMVVERLEGDVNQVRHDRDALIEEKRILKTEIMELKKEASQHRMETADLKRDIQRIKRELEEEKVISRLAQNNRNSSPPETRVASEGERNSGKAARPRRKTPGCVRFKATSQGRKHKQLSPSNGRRETFVRGGHEKEEEDWEELSEESDEDNEAAYDGSDRVLLRRQRGHRTRSADDVDLTYRRDVGMRPSTRSTSASAKHVQRLQAPPKICIHYSPEGRQPTTSCSSEILAKRDAGTSPIGSQVSPGTTARKVSTNHPAVRQLKSMKQRVSYLQQQVITLRDSRATALKSLEEQTENNTRLQGDLNLANQRLRMTKQNVQKLTSDLDKMAAEKTELEKRLTSDYPPNVDTAKHDHEIKVLEARLKSSTNELSRQNNVVRQLKQENEAAQDQNRVLQDKMNHMERDLNQKRHLLDDQRSRMKTTLENAKADAENMMSVEMKLKLLQDTNDKNKIQTDSYKKRLSAVTREKRDYEERFLRLSADIEKKNSMVLDSQSKKMDLEEALIEMERTAKQQLTGLARESESAIESAHAKLTEVQTRLQRYQYFVRTLSAELLRRVSQTRSMAKEEAARKSEFDKSNASLKRARDLAKNILNISQSDLDDIMSADGGESGKLESELEVQRRRDKKWSKKIEKLQQGKEDFVHGLVELFLQKIEERNEITARIHATRADQSELTTVTTS